MSLPPKGLSQQTSCKQYGTSGFGMSNTAMLYMAIKAIQLTYHRNDGRISFEVSKDRNGIHGERNLQEAIEEVADIITIFKFQNSNELFQTNIRKRLIEVMNDVLLGDDCIPKGEI